MHLLWCEFPGEDIEVFCHSVCFCGFGDGQYVVLNVPAEDDLGGGASLFCGYGVDPGVVEGFGVVA